MTTFKDPISTKNSGHLTEIFNDIYKGEPHVRSISHSASSQSISYPTAVSTRSILTTNDSKFVLSPPLGSPIMKQALSSDWTKEMAESGFEEREEQLVRLKKNVSFVNDVNPPESVELQTSLFNALAEKAKLEQELLKLQKQTHPKEITLAHKNDQLSRELGNDYLIVY